MVRPERVGDRADTDGEPAGAPHAARFAEQRLGLLVTALFGEHLGKVLRTLRHAHDVAGTTPSDEALLHVGGALIPSAGVERIDTTVVEHRSETGEVAEFLVDGLGEQPIVHRLLIADLVERPVEEVVGVRLGGSVVRRRWRGAAPRRHHCEHFR